MKREQCDLKWLFKVNRKSLALIFGGLVLTTGSAIATPSLAPEQQISSAIAQADVSAEAEKLREQGRQLVQEGSEESLRKAIVFFEKARNLSLSANVKIFEFLDLSQLGLIYQRLKDKQQALEYFNQALVASMRKELRDVLPGLSRFSEASARMMIGKIHDDSPGEEQKALDFYQQALTILREKEIVKEFSEKSRNLEATLLYNTGMIYDRLGKNKQAVEYFEQSLSLDSKVSDPIQQATRFNNICSVLRQHGQIQRALNFCNEALKISREESVRKAFVEKSRHIEAVTLQNIGDVYSDLGETQKALESYGQALLGYQSKVVRDTFPEESTSGESDTYNQIGLIYHRQGRAELALESFGKSLVLSQGLGDFGGQAMTLQNMGNSHERLNRRQEAWITYNKALEFSRNPVFRKNSLLESLRSESAILKSMGEFQRISGNYQQALDFFEATRKISTEKSYREAYPAESRRVAALIYNDIAQVYQDSGQPQKALESYETALSILKDKIVQDALPLESRLEEAAILSNLGTLYEKLCLTEKSPEQIMSCYRERVIDSFNKASKIARDQEIRQNFPGKSLDLEVVALNNIAHFLSKLTEYRKALEIYDLALPLVRQLNDPSRTALVLNGKGFTHFNLRDDLSALDSYREALSLIQNAGDKNTEAVIHTNISVLYQRQGNLPGALAEINAAVDIVEGLRGKFRDSDLKTSYFASMQDIYVYKIDLLMQLHKQQPQKDYDRQALETSDRARARSLIELLTESRADVRKGVSKDLLDQEKELQQKLDATEKRFTQLASNSSAQAEVAKAQQEIKALNQDQTQLKDKIRRESPAYASLKYPEPLKFVEIQQQLDPDTVLLQYTLGEERSYLWAVTKTGMTSYILPGKKEIEQAAKDLIEVLQNPGMNGVSVTTPDSKGRSVTSTANKLSDLILKPVANQLGSNRLIIVADGALQYVPFAALSPSSSTGKSYNPLIATNEIVNLPSASTIAILRNTVLKGRKPAPKTLAVLADPVFGKDDPRVSQKSSQANRSSTNLSNTAIATTTTLPSVTQSAFSRLTRNFNLGTIPRLEYSGKEGRGILAKVPDTSELEAFGFNANYNWLSNPELKQYQYIHLATHGFFDERNPELSGLILSMIDPQGNPQERGFLRLGDLFNLDFSADLVVLSACQSGLGENIRGEGIIGMTRGLMYAGTPRVVTSLWNVNDEATAVLMEQFYNTMLKEGKTPAAALREAQRAMWQQGANPYLWAAFTLQGEWR